MAIIDLKYHPFAYVTIGELAEYWRLRRRHVIEHINAGDVEAIKVGPGYRIRTTTAIAFEQRALGRRAWRQSPLAVQKPSVRRVQPAGRKSRVESDGGTGGGQSYCGKG
jgi:excisionase family DNA binding protein